MGGCCSTTDKKSSVRPINSIRPMDPNSPVVRPLPKIKVNQGKKQQGWAELKTNYVLNSRTKVIGVNEFGKVFKTCRT